MLIEKLRDPTSPRPIVVDSDPSVQVITLSLPKPGIESGAPFERERVRLKTRRTASGADFDHACQEQRHVCI
ncbi:hypothetical protein [Mesorhizobium sp.]|uniref:hypothetical protein n=1 Tax=Mesorhizobium sp. TaxID=1871066 RepID=UPI000FE66529|nr:hypothetical protein [Mesorhizobium sp.]RWC54744.1 MAG: hypothetical protein EOS56_27990 [Mesorhizobium sp.]